MEVVVAAVVAVAMAEVAAEMVEAPTVVATAEAAAAAPMADRIPRAPSRTCRLLAVESCAPSAWVRGREPGHVAG